jgi:hypothetical protein
MDNDATPQLRSIRVDAYGNSAAELEMYALDAARDFFGPDVMLRIVRNYQVVEPMVMESRNTGGKKWYARVKIEVEG